VANQIYATVFNQEWVEQELNKKRQIIGERYEVLKELDKQAFIHTYLAKDQHRSKQYVIKQLIPVSRDSDTLEETKRLVSRKLRDFGKIDSSLIPDLDPYFEEDNFYIIQEYIDGHNLDEDNEIKSGQRWSEPDVINLLIEILESLVSIHQQGLAHRNLKPANLRRWEQSPNKKIVSIDFGFLKEIAVTMANPGQSVQPQHIGAVGYIPPQETGDWSEFSVDIYAVGMIGIQALTGFEPKNLPHDQQTGEIIWRFATPDKTMVEVSEGLASVLTKMVRHRVVDRYSNALDVYQDLKKLQARKRSFYSWLTDKRVLAASIGILLLTNVLSVWWYQKSAAEQKNIEQASVSNTRLNEQTQQCNQPIQAKQTIKTSLVNRLYR
jgi:serine/threonine-protein kinase